MEQTIGPYRVMDKLGEGGMGQVYRAHDTRLNRDVAIKTLPPAVGDDPERVARFEREAQILASLHHPNIAGIYGLEQSGGATYLVLELVLGRPLDRVLKADGPFEPAEAVAIARQIAGAIAAAHEKGIIHRDLKPANVMLTPDGHVKVLDFGLGKALDGGLSPAETPAANSPTVTMRGTQLGVVLGTAGYMSPEQAKGHAADRRSDVWSFGCLLFELLAGSRAFEGEDLTDTIAAIVRGEANMTMLPTSTPRALRELIERTLIKDRSRRLPDMSVVQYILNEPGILDIGSRQGAASATELHGAKVRATVWIAKPWAMVSIAVLVAATVLTYVLLGGAPPPVTMSAAPLPEHFAIDLPEGSEVVRTDMAPLAISPDGRTVAFSGSRAGHRYLFINDITTGETRALDGTDTARSPFFSPDGRWIGFFEHNKLKKITIGGASLQEIADAPDASGGTWSSDDVIYYGRSTAGLWKVAASGGTGTELTKPDSSKGETSHRYPYVLPGGKALLFVVWAGPSLDEHRIDYLSLADGSRQVVVPRADGPIAVVNGHIVYAGRRDTLISAPWNQAHPSLQGVEPTALPFSAEIDTDGVSAYAVSASGTFVRLNGSAGRRLAKIVRIDASGRLEPLPLPDRDYVSIVTSPDGTRAAIEDRDDRDEIWIYNFGTRDFTPMLSSGSTRKPSGPSTRSLLSIRAHE